MNEQDLEQLKDLIPLLIPILIVQLALIIAALVDLIRRPVTRGPKWVWLIIILFVNLLGPIAYFVFGREDE